MLKQSLKRGFTLIELLVVIAIIGILATVVIVSLNNARDKANDVSASGSLSSIKNAAELYYDDNNGSYASVCDDAEVNTLESAADDRNGSNAPPTCVDDASEYAVEVQLSGGDFFCVDSTGFAGKSATTTSLADTTGNRVCD